jgi:phosphate transport system substrate-binding protein
MQRDKGNAARRLRSAPAAPLLLALAAVLPAAAPVSAQVEARTPISVVGPASVFPFAVAAGERFSLETGNEMPVVEPVGTDAGMALFCAGNGARHPDIVLAAGRLERRDFGACGRGGVSMSELRLGYQAVALAQNPGPAPLFLTRQQLFLALAREVPVNGRLVANPYRLWSDIDFALPVKPIEIFGPPPGSPLRDSLVALLMAPAAAQVPALRGRPVDAFRSDGVFVELAEDQAETRAQLLRRPDAIGLFGFNYLAANATGVHSVPIDGVPPSQASIADGSYALARPLQLYVKRAHATAIPGLRDYLAEMLSPAAGGAGGYLILRGLVPMPPAEAEAQRAAARSLPPL